MYPLIFIPYISHSKSPKIPYFWGFIYLLWQIIKYYFNEIFSSDFMGYLICEKCGGYYELEEGESFDDFNGCQCGGKLSYSEQVIGELEKRDKPKLICSNCMKENKNGIFCSSCGGRLIAVKGGKAVSNIKNFQESKELEKLSRRTSRKEKNYINDFNEPKDLFERINWLVVLAGTGFFVISMVILGSILFFSIVSSYSYGYSSYYSSFSVAFFIAMILGLLLAIVSGVLTAYVSRSRDYVDGLVNGFLVGLISSVVIGLFGGVLIIFIGIIVFGALTAVGGAMGIFVRRQMDK